MPGFIPLFILAGAAITIPIFRFVQRGAGIAWIYAIVCSVAAWVSVLVLKSSLPYSFTYKSWSELGIIQIFPNLEINLINWPFVFFVSAVVCGSLFASSARLSVTANFREWVGILSIGTIGILGSMAGNIFTIIFFLALLDLVEIVVFSIFLETDSNKRKEIYSNYFWRFSGLFVLIIGSVIQISITSTDDSWQVINKIPGYLVLAGCIIRLGIVPLSNLTGTLVKSKNGVLITRYLVSIILVISILFKIPANTDVSIWKTILQWYLLITAIVSSIQIHRKEKGSQLAQWQILLATIFISEYLFGFSTKGIMFFLTAIVLTMVFFLDYPGSRFSRVLAIFALTSFSGLPFTPNENGLLGFIQKGPFPGYLFLLPAASLFYWAVSHVSHEEEPNLNPGERWLNVISPFGLLFPIATTWIIYYFWTGEKHTFHIEIESLLVVLGATSIFIAIKAGILEFSAWRRIKINEKLENSFVFLRKSKRNFPLDGIVTFPYRFIISLFEGEGGILWTILCLVLVITVIRSLGSS